MKRLRLFYVLFMCYAASASDLAERKIVVVVASYNNQQWCEKNLKSVFDQKYDNWEMIYIDDKSTDDTLKKVKCATQQAGMQGKVTIIENSTRKGALENLYNAIHSCADTAIIVTLDGDDWLYDEQVLARVKSAYADNNTWLTYGQFIEYPSGKHGFCCAMSDDVVKSGCFRSCGYLPSHLRTFYAGLFKRIKKEDLTDKQGHFFMMAWDVAMMLPMIEMARHHFKFIPEIMYVYNTTNPLNDHNVSRWLQLHIDKFIHSKPSYEKVETLF
jgi:glycosyltransferase involved in cell wall biosynthesis